MDFQSKNVLHTRYKVLPGIFLSFEKKRVSDLPAVFFSTEKRRDKDLNKEVSMKKKTCDWKDKAAIQKLIWASKAAEDLFFQLHLQAKSKSF
jgi:hypothetical protein